MILTAVELSAVWKAIARRYGIDPKSAPRKAMSAARRAAAKLATEPELEPAAIFYAFARRPSALPKRVRRRMLLVLVSAQAKQHDKVVQVAPQRFNQATARVQGNLGPVRWSFARTSQEVDSWLAAGSGGWPPRLVR